MKCVQKKGSPKSSSEVIQVWNSEILGTHRQKIQVNASFVCLLCHVIQLSLILHRMTFLTTRQSGDFPLDSEIQKKQIRL